MTLYEINQAIEEAIEAIFESADEETGEVDESCVHVLEDLQIQKDEKIENIGCYIKNLDAEVTALKAEELNLKARRESKEKKIDRLKVYVAQQLNGENWDKSSRVAFKFRSSDQTIIDDESMIPQMYMKVKTEQRPDKTAIKKAIAGGEAVPGAHVEKKRNMSII